MLNLSKSGYFNLATRINQVSRRFAVSSVVFLERLVEIGQFELTRAAKDHNLKVEVFGGVQLNLGKACVIAQSLKPVLNLKKMPSCQYVSEVRLVVPRKVCGQSLSGGRRGQGQYKPKLQFVVPKLMVSLSRVLHTTGSATRVERGLSLHAAPHQVGPICLVRGSSRIAGQPRYPKTVQSKKKQYS